MKHYLRTNPRTLKIWDKNLEHKFLLALWSRFVVGLVTKCFYDLLHFIYFFFGEKFLISHIHIFNDRNAVHKLKDLHSPTRMNLFSSSSRIGSD